MRLLFRQLWQYIWILNRPQKKNSHRRNTENIKQKNSLRYTNNHSCTRYVFCVRFGGDSDENGSTYYQYARKAGQKNDTRDPYEFCRLLGIKVHYHDMQKKLKGFFYYQSRQKNIVIDSNVNEVLECLSEYSFFETARKLYVLAALLDYKFSLLHEKGELVNPMYIKKTHFLKEDLGDYDNGQQFE